jgi:hypothetical protein
MALPWLRIAVRVQGQERLFSGLIESHAAAERKGKSVRA